jgi:hypothetical protein
VLVAIKFSSRQAVIVRLLNFLDLIANAAFAFRSSLIVRLWHPENVEAFQ